MAAPLVVIIIFAAGDMGAPSTQPMIDAARATLPADTAFEVRALAPRLPESSAIAEAERRGAAVVDVAWLDELRTHARLRIFVAGRSGAISRDFVFETIDAPGERGRSVGLALASILSSPRRPDAPSPEPPRISAVSPVEAVEEARGAGARESAREPGTGEPSVAAGGARTWALYAAGLAVTPLGGGAAFGATVAGERQLRPDLSLRASASFGFATITPADASGLTFRGGAGIRYALVIATADQPFGLAARADVLVVHQTIARFSEELRRSERRSRWMPALDLAGEGSWTVGDATALVLAAGVEGTGEISVFAHRREVTTLPPVRAILELGVRTDF